MIVERLSGPNAFSNTMKRKYNVTVAC